jgi:hypothetical protein
VDKVTEIASATAHRPVEMATGNRSVILRKRPQSLKIVSEDGVRVECLRSKAHHRHGRHHGHNRLWDKRLLLSLSRSYYFFNLVNIAVTRCHNHFFNLILGKFLLVNFAHHYRY